VGDDAGQGIGLGPQVDPLEEGGDEGARRHVRSSA
jgi:hypothetical protein